MTMKRITLLIVLLFAVAVHAEEPPTAPALQEQLQEVEHHLVRNGVPVADAQATIRAMVQARFTTEQAVQAGKQLVSEGRWGITGQAIRDKIHEGVAKGVSPENILSATERVRARVEFAGKLAAGLHEANNVSIVGTYVDCLAAGLSEQHAHQLANALQARAETQRSIGNQSLTTETLLTARDMVRRNIASATATGVLESALDRGYNDKEMRTLRQSLASSLGDPENTARRFGAAIGQGARAGDLQGLGNSGYGSGERPGMGQGAADGSGGSGSSGSGGSGGGSGGGGSGGGGSGGGGGGGRH